MLSGDFFFFKTLCSAIFCHDHFWARNTAQTPTFPDRFEPIDNTSIIKCTYLNEVLFFFPLQPVLRTIFQWYSCNRDKTSKKLINVLGG